MILSHRRIEIEQLSRFLQILEFTCSVSNVNTISVLPFSLKAPPPQIKCLGCCLDIRPVLFHYITPVLFEIFSTLISKLQQTETMNTVVIYL